MSLSTPTDGAYVSYAVDGILRDNGAFGTFFFSMSPSGLLPGHLND